MHEQLTKYTPTYDKPFYETFIIALIICLSPLKAVALFSPFICLTWFIVRSKSGFTLRKLFFLITGWGLLLLFYNVYGSQIGLDFNPSNGIVSLIFYSAIILAFAFPFKLTSNDYNYVRYTRIILFVLAIEGLWGIMQKTLAPIILGTQSGDVVEGTINPFSFIFGHSGFSNQFFAINIVCFLFFCYPFIIANKKKAIPFMLAFIALILASVGHVFYSMLMALSLTFLIFEGHNIFVKPKLLIAFSTLFLIIIIVFANLDSAMYELSKQEFDSFVSGESAKTRAAYTAIFEAGAEYPTMHLVGVGPGQYSSRAGIVSTGTYFGLSEFFTAIPFLNINTTKPLEDFVMEDWNFITENFLDPEMTFTTSTMHRPFFSVLSVYAEFGGLTLILIVYFILKQVFRLRKKYTSLKSSGVNPHVRQLAFSCSATILFLFFIGMYENYYESPQGIFLGILLVLIMRSIVFSKQNDLNLSDPNQNISKSTRKPVFP